MGGAAGVGGAVKTGAAGAHASSVDAGPVAGMGSVVARAGAAVAAAADRFGLAFFVAQRACGLASASAIFALLRGGADVQGTLEALVGADALAAATGSGSAGAAVGAWAAAAVAASALYPAVIAATGPLGLWLGRRRASRPTFG